MQERATVPVSFLRDMLTGARRQLRAQDIDAIATQAGISPLLLRQGAARVTREQFVRMYEGVALFMGDEMLGLWSRPIRAGALKYLGLSLLDAPSLMVAMYRFTRFWNLLLDDYRLRMARANGVATVTIAPRLDGTTPTPFGHELMVKLIHGVASWLVGRQLPVLEVGFAFRRPATGVTLGDAATSLHMSERALSRKLASEGTSFRAVKEEVRRDVAIQRLVKTREPIDLIAASVGFDNTPAFHRAFRTWTGSTPRGYRLRASSD